MRKNKVSAERNGESVRVEKKNRRSSFLAFLVCIFLAMVIWAYSEADKVGGNSTANNVESTTDVA